MPSDTRREVAERIARTILDPWHVEPEYLSSAAKQIDAALKDRDERAVRLIREHRASDKCDMDCWTTISTMIRNEESP